MTPSSPYSQAFSDGLRPDPLLTVSEWADEFRMLSQKASAEPGRYRTSRTPFLKAIMDALSPASLCRFVTFMKGAQIGGTECGLNWIGYMIDCSPGPFLSVSPTVEMAKRTSKQRLDPLISECPSLRAKVSERETGDKRAHDTVLGKEFPGGCLILTGANSGSGLRSMPARFIFLDECDAYPMDVDGEGDPVNLAIARARTFTSRSKVFRVSTPTIKGRSRIETAFDEGTGETFHVPCPFCGEMQPLVFPNLKWPKGQPGEAQYQCAGCDKLIPEHHKTWMFERGEWVALRPELMEEHRSFHLSSLYSPIGWFSWGEAAAMWDAAQKDSFRLKVVINTILGETWEDRGEVPEYKRLLERCEHYPANKVPMGGLVLVAGTDIQKDRIESSVYAFGRFRQCWLISHAILDGNTALEPVWDKLTELLNTSFEHVNGTSMSIVRMGVDSGFRTNEVYTWVRNHGIGRAFATKGMDHGSAPLGQPTAQDVSVGGRKLARGIKLWPVATPLLKAELYSRLNLEPPSKEELAAGTPYPLGYVHLTDEVANSEFVQQLTGEQLVTRTVKGFPKTSWTRCRDRVECLDTWVLARAAANLVGIDRFSDAIWAQWEAALNIAPTAPAPAPVSQPVQPVAPVAPQRQPDAPRRGGGWLDRRSGWLK